MADFDPYYIWLSIPPSEQPPDHYRLLGVSQFEPNLDVISAAADRQMAHLRTYQHGAHSADSQRLLNEVSRVRGVLLSAESKARYDEELKRKLAPATPVVPLAPVAKVLKPAAPVALPVQPLPVQPVALSPGPQPAASKKPPKPAAPEPLPEAEAKPEAKPAPASPAAQPKVGMPPAALLAILGGVALLLLIVVGVVGIVGMRLWFDKPTPPIVGPGRIKSKPPLNLPMIDPWKTGNYAETPSWGPGSYTLLYDQNSPSLVVREANTKIDYSAGVENMLPRSFDVKTRFDLDRRPFVVSTGSSESRIVLAIKAKPGCTISDALFTVPLLVEGPIAGPDHYASWSLCDKFDFRSWSSKAGILKQGRTMQYPAIPPGSNRYDSVIDSLSKLKTAELYCVIRLHGQRMQLHLTRHGEPSHLHRLASFTIVKTDVTTPQVETKSMAATKPGLIRPRSIEQLPRYARIAPPRDYSDLTAQASARTTDGQALSWLLAAQSEDSPNMRYALLRLALQSARAQGDVFVADAAYQQIEQRYAVDTLSEEIACLKQMYQDAYSAFQPVAFASWSDRVFGRLAEQGQLAENETLIHMALACARESGDRDLIARITLWAGQRKP